MAVRNDAVFKCFVHWKPLPFIGDVFILSPMPRLIALGGPMGAGKTTLAYRLRREVPSLADALVIDNDAVRRDLLGYDLRPIMPDTAYTVEITQQVRARSDAMIRDALAQGRDVIDSTGFWSIEARAHIKDIARECGVAFIGLWLCAPRERLIARINARMAERRDPTVLDKERGHASDACPAVLDKYAHLPPPLADDPDWQFVDASQEIEAVLAEVDALLVLTGSSSDPSP